MKPSSTCDWGKTGTRSEKPITFEASFPAEEFLASSALVTIETLVWVQVDQLYHISKYN